MSTHDFSRWTPQRPSDDFADRTVEAMLAPSERSSQRTRRRRGRVSGGLLLAAILLGASAWGMLARRGATPPPFEPAKAELPTLAPPLPAVPVATDAAPPPPPPEPDPPVPERRAAPAARPRKPAPPSSAPGREPLCHCQADLAVCGCLE